MTRDELLGADHRIKVMVACDNEVGFRCESAIGELVIIGIIDAEREGMMTRQTPYEPSRAFVLLG